MLDLKIVGGTIVDGSGAPRYQGDVGIKDGQDHRYRQGRRSARETIDAAGKIVAPGFVDVHTHYDAQVFWDPTLSPSCYHGVTTVFGGYCGFSIAPLSKESGQYLMPMLARVEGMPLESLRSGAKWDWTTFAEYLSRFEGTLAINAGFLAGHSTIRRYVMGPDAIRREATRAEIEQMKELLRESIRGGALGFSTTLVPAHNDADGMPVPSRHASREEVIEFFAVVSEFEGTTAELLPAIDFTQETYELLTQASLAAQRPVNWNSITIARGMPDELQQMEYRLRATNYARERGAEVIALTIPHTATVLLNLVGGVVFDALDGWAPFFRLSIAERIEKLRDREYRANMKRQAEEKGGRLMDLVKWDRLRIDEVFSHQNEPYEGRLIGDIAAEEGRDPFDVFAEVAIADELRTNFHAAVRGGSADLYKARAKLWADSRVVIGASDAGAHLDMINTFSFPTAVLESGVRKFKVITLENAVHDLTQRPAELIGLKDRGLLKTGWHADIVIFDIDKVGPGKLHTRRICPRMACDYTNLPEGIHHVIVNGREIIRDNTYLGVAGRHHYTSRQGHLYRDHSCGARLITPLVYSK